MKKYSKIFIALVATAVIAACGGDDTDDGPPPAPPVAAPTAATIVFPPNNTVCNEGVILSATQSSVTFDWNPGENTDAFTVVLTNLNTNGTQRFNSAIDELAITIQRGTPYEWFVESNANGTDVSASSASARFFNEGPGITNFAPFPAEAIQPTRGAGLPSTTETVVLEWETSDTDGDGDITEFEVFFGTNSADLPSLGSLDDTSISDVPVASGTVYFWQVITTDSHGNTSTSDIFEFQVL